MKTLDLRSPKVKYAKLLYTVEFIGGMFLFVAAFAVIILIMVALS